jgi:Effector protein
VSFHGGSGRNGFAGACQELPHALPRHQELLAEPDAWDCPTLKQLVGPVTTQAQKLLNNPKFTISLTENSLRTDEADEFTYGDRPGSGSSNGHIDWNPHLAITGYNDADSTAAISPAVSLLHEAAHAEDFVSNPDQYFHDMSEPDDQFGNLEDRRVITQVENPALESLGLPQMESHSQGSFCTVHSVGATSC